MNYDFESQLKEDEKKYNISSKGEYFQFAEGDNKIRVLSPGVPMGQHFLGNKKRPAICFGEDEGCPFHKDDSTSTRPKWVMWVFDYADNKIKLARMPYTIIQTVARLQKSSEYAFDSLPMPYDITIVAKNAGSKEVNYSVVPARSNTEISKEV